MKYQDPIWEFGKPEAKNTLWRYNHLILTSRLIFHWKLETLRFSHSSSDLAIYLCGIVVTDGKWCPSIIILRQGHRVTVNFVKFVRLYPQSHKFTVCWLPHPSFPHPMYAYLCDSQQTGWNRWSSSKSHNQSTVKQSHKRGCVCEARRIKKTVQM